MSMMGLLGNGTAGQSFPELAQSSAILTLQRCVLRLGPGTNLLQLVADRSRCKGAWEIGMAVYSVKIGDSVTRGKREENGS